MSDILTAQCSILTVLSIFLGLWYSEIYDLLNKNNIPTKSTEEQNYKKELRNIRNTKITILTVMSIGFCVIFIPTTLKIVNEFIQFLRSKDKNMYSYNPEKASIVFISVVSIFFVVLCIIFIYKINKRLKK